MLEIFFGCTHNVTIPMYGIAAEADFEVSGTVLSADQNLPIKGLSVSIRDTSSISQIIDSTMTDSLGRYSLQFFRPPGDNTWDLKVKDVDSVENGLFATKDTIISIPLSDLKEGHGEKSVDLKMNK
jgi:putative lipoprotein (rSAM/lipoprotein system)